jgi:hypothetical protein
MERSIFPECAMRGKPAPYSGPKRGTGDATGLTRNNPIKQMILIGIHDIAGSRIGTGRDAF